MELRPYQVTHALMDPERRLVMSYQAALRLAEALEIEAGAQFFTANVDLALPPEHGVDEAVVPLPDERIEALYRAAGARRSARAQERDEDQ